jgi:hypothetical protein
MGRDLPRGAAPVVEMTRTWWSSSLVTTPDRSIASVHFARSHLVCSIFIEPVMRASAVPA